MRSPGAVSAVPGRALVDYGRLLDVLGIEAELLATAAHGAARDAPVPGCPGLTLGETVRHLGSVYRLVATWIAQEERPADWRREPEPGESAENYLRAGLESLLGPLGAAPPEQRCATWWPADTSYGFWRRRMAHETTVHRVDVQAAAGRDLGPVPPDVALDGIDEVLTLWFERRLGLLGVTGTHRARVAVRSGDREWVVTTGDERHGTTRLAAGAGPEPVDARVSGPPQEMYLWLWGRVPHHVVSRSGDEDAIAQLWALLRLATR